jgi:hypothetical protein
LTTASISLASVGLMQLRFSGPIHRDPGDAVLELDQHGLAAGGTLFALRRDVCCPDFILVSLFMSDAG